jgi:hypothetical protein
MARYKAGVLLIAALFLTLPAYSLTFDVSITDITEASVKDVQYQENVSAVQNINASIENTGSIGCGYRLKADYSYGNKSFDRYSPEYSLWQGDTERAAINIMASNHTGTVHGNLSVEYCGQSKQVTDFNYSTENVTFEEEIDTRTLDVNQSSAQVRFSEYSEGTLVPVEAPPYWRTSSVKLEEGKASLDYEAPIFDSRENITYALVQNQTVQGTSEISLEEQPTLLSKILNVEQTTLYTLIILLGLLNVAQILRTRRKQD